MTDMNNFGLTADQTPVFTTADEAWDLFCNMMTDKHGYRIVDTDPWQVADRLLAATIANRQAERWALVTAFQYERWGETSYSSYAGMPYFGETFERPDETPDFEEFRQKYAELEGVKRALRGARDVGYQFATNVEAGWVQMLGVTGFNEAWSFFPVLEYLWNSEEDVRFDHALEWGRWAEWKLPLWCYDILLDGYGEAAYASPKYFTSVKDVIAACRMWKLNVHIWKEEAIQLGQGPFWKRLFAAAFAEKYYHKHYDKWDSFMHGGKKMRKKLATAIVDAKDWLGCFAAEIHSRKSLLGKLPDEKFWRERMVTMLASDELKEYRTNTHPRGFNWGQVQSRIGFFASLDATERILLAELCTVDMLLNATTEVLGYVLKGAKADSFRNQPRPVGEEIEVCVPYAQSSYTHELNQLAIVRTEKKAWDLISNLSDEAFWAAVEFGKQNLTAFPRIVREILAEEVKRAEEE